MLGTVQVSDLYYVRSLHLTVILQVTIPIYLNFNFFCHDSLTESKAYRDLDFFFTSLRLFNVIITKGLFQCKIFMLGTFTMTDGFCVRTLSFTVTLPVTDRIKLLNFDV